MTVSRFLCLLFAAVCAATRVPPEASAARGQTKKTYSRSATDGVITGTITFAGQPPPPKSINMDADPACAALNPHAKAQDVVVTEGKLANIFVYVKSGGALDDYQFESVSTPAVLEHRKCQYAPRLLGVQVGQPLSVVNADPTTHNTHPSTKANREWNRSQSPGLEPMVMEGFTQPEQFIPFKCNQHPWERAYVGVFAHPFFAVSARDGSYRIEGLPPGEYTIVAWHEKFGEQEEHVSLVPYQWRVIDFTFKAEAAAR